jgi:hypothetical protein
VSGAPRSAYTSGEFIAVRRDAVKALGSWEAAGVWHRICWRAERDGSWVASIAAIADDCCLSEHKTKVALQAIRKAGWITAVRAASADRTLAWSPVWDDEPSGEFPLYVEGDSIATPSSKTVETSSDDGGLFSAPAAAARAEAGNGFDQWYALYPKKRGKAAAVKKYAQAAKRVGDDVLLGALRAQLPGMLSKIERDGTKDYLKDPATWLHQGCWEDEVEATNVTPIRRDHVPSTSDVYDPAAAALLPPPRTSPW